jgi:hypothetical protein
MGQEYQKAKEVASQVNELINSKIGRYSGYVASASVVHNSKHNIPEDYNKKFYIVIINMNDVPMSKELELPNELEGILICHEQIRGQFASTSINTLSNKLA